MHPEADGVQLGHYRVSRLIGSGGMGEVYLARDGRLGRDVAIKFLSDSGDTNAVLARRLLQEAQAVAALDHPSICPVYDVGVHPDGRPYMVMQYVQGETLSARLARGRLSMRETLTTCAQIADALSAAHRRGIVHRDLKPQNIIITPAGQPKLLDFGLSKFLPSFDSLAATADTATALTKVHAIPGTPAYMSPEQIQQAPIDGRSDLFALGAIFYECLTGRQAFTGTQTFDVLANVVHVHPPSPSALQPDLDPALDELCRRLLAKDPADRFQSADEVVGAMRLVQPDSSRATPPAARDRQEQEGRRHLLLRRRAAYVAIAAVVIAVAGFRVVDVMRTRLPSPSADAERWYIQGTDALRQGAFHSAATALEEAARLFPKYPAVYARLAEARAEMDDERGAQAALVRVSEHLPDQSRLPGEERQRLDAIRSLVLGDADAAVRAYRALAEATPSEAGAWVDLGRAQERTGQLLDARNSYTRAVASDRQYAGGYLRLGIVEAALGHREAGLAALAEAERLFRVALNKEGEAEVLIRRGALLDAVGEFQQARTSLERALAIAQTVENSTQTVRAELHLSSVTVSEGRFADAERLATAAVQAALDGGLEATAADGLVDSANALTVANRLSDAEKSLQRAMNLADKRGARRTAARAATQRAFVQFSQGQALDALASLNPALEYFKSHRYRRYELKALSIASRAHQHLDQIPAARELATQVLKEAEVTNDESQVAEALATLASQSTLLGVLPEALALRERAEAIHRRQRDGRSLPYDLTNRAELLILLGRNGQAAAALAEVEEGIQKKLDVYVGRQRRVTFLRALEAMSQCQYPAGSRHRGTPSIGWIGFGSRAGARRGRVRVRPATSPAPEARGDPRCGRQSCSAAGTAVTWYVATALALGNAAEALTAAHAAVEQAATIKNDELQWRLAALGSIAARSLGNTRDHQLLRAKAHDALTRLRSAWGDHTREYENRPDLTELLRAAKL